MMRPEVKTEERRERMRISEMDPYHWHKIAAVSGIAALGLGTYGFHIFKPEKPIFKEFGALLTAGILTFSGSCYTAAYLEDRKFSALAPFGGLAFVAAWASLLF